MWFKRMDHGNGVGIAISTTCKNDLWNELKWTHCILLACSNLAGNSVKSSNTLMGHAAAATMAMDANQMKNQEKKSNTKVLRNITNIKWNKRLSALNDLGFLELVEDDADDLPAGSAVMWWANTSIFRATINVLERTNTIALADINLAGNGG